MLKSKEILLNEKKHDFESLVSIMDILRGDNGCPWDKEQTHQSIRKCLIEETYEVIEAIDTDNAKLLKEELGDLIFQAVFHSKIEAENECFDIYDVIDGICTKMINRHPHVFLDENLDSAEKVSFNWDIIKLKEKKQGSVMESIRSFPPELPSLLKAQKVHHKALSKLDYGFKTREEAVEFAKRNMDVSLSDAIFALAVAADFDGIDIEKELNDSVKAFIDGCDSAK